MYAVNEAVVYLCMDSASLSAGGGGRFSTRRWTANGAENLRRLVHRITVRGMMRGRCPECSGVCHPHTKAQQLNRSTGLTVSFTVPVQG